MGHYDRPDGSKTVILPVPDRLQRLDDELTSGAKQFDYVFAVRETTYEYFRIKVCIFKMPGAQPGDYPFVATCSIGGKVHRQHGHKPSHAFIKITESLRWATSKLTYEKNVKAQEDKKRASAQG